MSGRFLHSTARTGTSLARLNSEWTHRFGPETRLEWRAGIGQSRAPVHSFRTEFTNGSESRTLEETSDSHDTSIHGERQAGRGDP